MTSAALTVALAGMAAVPALATDTPATSVSAATVNAAAAVLAAGTATLDISGVTITGHLSDVTRDVLVNPYTVGEQLAFTFDVHNTRSESVTVTPTAGPFTPFVPADGAGNCRWMGLAADASYSCTTAKHVITADDLTAGYFNTVSAWQVGTEKKTLSTPDVAVRANVATAVGQLSISGTPVNPGRNTAASPYAVGDKVPYQFTVTNNGSTAIDVVPQAGSFTPFLVADGAGNCRYRGLAAGKSYTCATPQHTVTQEELDQGYFLPATSWTAGSDSATITTDAVKLATPLADPLSGYLNASAADRGLGFHDVDKDGQSRTIRNDLTGALGGMVEFAQTHTVNPSDNDSADMPDLVAEREALLLFTPTESTTSVTVTASVKGVAKGTFDMATPDALPETDADFPGGRPEVVYSERAWSVDLPWDVVVPGLELVFAAANGTNGTLPASNITMGAPNELVINNIELGMLTTPNMNGDHAFIDTAAQSAADYFQTVPVSRLIMAKYESVELDKVIVASGNIYTTESPSVTTGDVYSGDMREDVGKAQVSTGINLANFGQTSGLMNQIQPGLFNERIIHHSAGLYANGRVEHGLSGGNGMATLYSSSGNELSHELGHSYGLGHYPGQDSSLGGDAATIKATHHADSGWEYNAYRNVLRPNLTMNAYQADGVSINGLNFTQTFANSYNYLVDAMSGGWVESNYSNYTFYTGYTADRIQENLTTVVPDLNYPSGYRTWDSAAQNYVDAKVANAAFTYQRPSAVGVPVVTLLGGYVPANSAKAVLYPAFRSNWGNTFAATAPILDGDSATRVCWMDVSFLNGANQQFAVSGGVSGAAAGTALQFNINIAQSEKPSGADLYCKKDGATVQYGNHIDIATDLPDMPAAVTIGQDAGYTAVSDVELPALEADLESQAGVAFPILSQDSQIALHSWKDSLDTLSTTAQEVANKVLARETAADNAAKFLRYYGDTIATAATQTRFSTLLADSGLLADASANVVSGATAVKVDLGAGGITAGYCLKLYTNDDGSVVARVPAAADVAAECTGSDAEKWVLDARGAVHNGAHPELCLTSVSPSQPAGCDSSSAAQQWSYQADGHLNSVAKPGYSMDLNRSTRLPILYGTTTGSNQKWTALGSSSALALALLDSASLKVVGELGL